MTIEIENQRPLMRSLWRGFRQRCPNCAQAKIYGKFLKVHENCTACSEELHHQRADDAPPYFTIFTIGHIVLPAALFTERLWHPSTFVHLSIWIPSILLLTFILLPRIKGLLIAQQWALRLHGFDKAQTATAEP